MQPAKHILCIHLPQWPITRYCRRHREQGGPKNRGAAIAVIQTIGQRRCVVDASDGARSSGIRIGLSAAEARALCPHIICIEANPAADRRALDALGRWMMHFTPVVANGWDDSPDGQPQPAALFLDLTGSERLFGGIDSIVAQVRQALMRFSIRGNIAVAPTPGAAWAFAATSGRNNRIITADQLPEAIKPLPIATLRLDEKIIADLFRLGLVRVSDLLVIPRDQLPLRFGKSLLMRLDQLTGERAEPLNKLVNDPPVTARAGFEAPIESLENIGLIFEKLLALVLSDLTRRNHGVRQLRMTLTPDRGWGREVVVRPIQLSRPHRDRATLLDLIRCEMDRVDCEHGFTHFELAVPLHEPVSDAQSQLFEQQAAQEKLELDKLFQRLRARLGEAAVIRPQRVESYIPERAWRPADDDVPGAATVTAPLPPRPLMLFQTPIEIRVICEPSDDRTGRPRQFNWQGNVHRLTQIVGPERIAGEWWRGHHRTRDYYDVEDEVGLRYWMFRVLRVMKENILAQWFLHGCF